MSDRSLAVEAEDLVYRLGSGQPILAAKSIAIPEKGLTAIVGANGAGKSTLLKLISGELTEYEGSLRVFGQEVRGVTMDGLPYHLRRVCVIPQDTYLPPGHTVRDTIWRSLADADVPERERDAAISDALAKVGLGGKLNDVVDHLSGGERRRVQVAQALARSAELILADEPMTAIDPSYQRQLLELFRDLSHAMPVVMVTHEQVDWLGQCDRTVLVNPPTVATSSYGVGGRATATLGREIARYVIVAVAAGMAVWALMYVLGTSGSGPASSPGPSYSVVPPGESTQAGGGAPVRQPSLVATLTVPRDSSRGITWTVPSTGTYEFRYVSGAYSTYPLNGAPPRQATWLASVCVFDGPPIWDGEVLRTSAAMVIGWGDQYFLTQAGAVNAASGQTLDSALTAGSVLSFVTVDKQSRYFDNAGADVVIEIWEN